MNKEMNKKKGKAEKKLDEMVRMVGAIHDNNNATWEHMEAMKRSAGYNSPQQIHKRHIERIKAKNNQLKQLEN